MNARDLISSAMKKIGVIASGETPSAAEAQDGLSALNMMIDSWSTQNLTLFELKREVFPFVPSQAEYTVGVGGNFNTARPMTVLGAAYLASSLEIPMEILSYQKWIGISIKDLTSTMPTQVYVHGEAPLEKLSFYPVPSDASDFVLYSRKQLSTFPDLDTEIDAPPGYEKAFIYNLALEIAPEFAKEPSALVVKNASDSLAKIKIKNSPVMLSRSDISTPRGRDRKAIFEGGQ